MGSKCTKSTSDADVARTSYRQQQHAGGVNSWIYAYENAATLTKSWIGCGLEIGVQIRGTWRHGSRFTGERTYARGTISRVSVGEPYSLAYEGRTVPGLQVGFILCAEQIANLDGELRFVNDSGAEDATFFEFCEWFGCDPAAASEQVEPAMRAYVRRHCELAPMTPLRRAKRELERHFTSDLPMECIASVGGLHPETFARQFKAAYGVTPANYRIAIRTNFASRLLWSRPDLSIAEVAEEAGFPNHSYFHRNFAKAFRTTPSMARARFLAA